MSGLKIAGKIIDGIEDWLACITFIAMTVVVIVIVLCRYVFKVPFMAGEEIARYLMIWCAYAGVAYGFRKHAHVGVVVFAEMLPQSFQKYIVIIRHILSSIIMIALCYFAYMVFEKYLSTGQITTVTKLPTAYVYIIIPIGLLLGTIHQIVDAVLSFKNVNTEENLDKKEEGK